MSVAPVFDTGCPFPTFGIVKPAVTNTRVDMSPYGQSVFADAVDAVQAVDLTFDALVSEIDVSKMCVFLSDVLFDREKSGDKTISIPFGKSDCTVFRKVMSTEDQDTVAEKEQDMREVGVTMAAWEYRVKWYGEEESVARARASEISTGSVKQDAVTSGTV
jgi:hypothetical protein